jgi:hypothetical protein
LNELLGGWPVALNGELQWLQPPFTVRAILREFALAIAQLADVQGLMVFQFNNARLFL